MKFKIIPNQQTPKIYLDMSAQLLISRNSKMLDKFISFARLQYNCVGLAANQVACDRERIMKPFFAIKNNHHWDMIINPKIMNYYGKREIKIEGCLTWLGKNIKAMRYPEIEVRYFNLKGEIIIKTIKGFEAQVWQHEYNHLMGIEEEIIDGGNDG